MRKRFLSFVMAVMLCLSLLPTGALAAGSYKINGVTVSIESYNTSSPGQCWNYAQKLYKAIWGQVISNSFDESCNSLRDLPDSALTLTEDHLKEYVTNAALGSVLRVTTEEYLHGGDSAGHSQVIVQKDSKGFTVLEGGLSEYPYCREHYYTWSEFVNTSWLGAKYGYIKYIKWPGAPAYTGTHVHIYTAEVTSATCRSGGYTTYTCTCGDSYVGDKTSVGWHIWVNDVCAVCGQTLSISRIAGQNRVDTAMVAAENLQLLRGGDLFDTMILASGTAFPDALTGSYLGTVTDAPILLYTDGGRDEVLEYIAANLAPGGTLYILGGTSAVPDLSGELPEGIKTVRLAGSTRFDTNLAILKQAGVRPGQEILVATAYNFADSLSASATGLPILLVGSSLTAEQQRYLSSLRVGRLTILGGTSAVSAELEQQLRAYGETRRLYGENRYETSVKIAETYFRAVDAVVITNGKNFPDGLSGGPVAYAMGAPLVLTAPKSEGIAKAYVTDHDVTAAYVLGGTSAVSESTVNKVFSR